MNKNTIEYFKNNTKPDHLNQICFAAHQDDVEFMSFQGILECLEENKNFGAVVFGDGSGSPRCGKFSNVTDDEMIKIRQKEQIKASQKGNYAGLWMLNYKSSQIKDKANQEIKSDIIELMKTYKPEIVYTHNLADKHDTHLGVAIKVINALRTLESEFLPKKLYGCEVWRGLDWVNDDEKVVFDVSRGRKLAMKLMNLFESQIEGGKNYALANDGRRFANATFASSHSVDTATQVMYSMDLSELISNKEIDIVDYIDGYIDRFKNDVNNKLRSLL